MEIAMGSQIGESIRIDDISSSIHYFEPEITLKGLHILDKSGKSAIKFGQVRVNLDIIRSIRQGKLNFGSVIIIGPKFSVRRQKDGSLTILGLNSGGSPPDWLLANGQITLREAEIDWQDLGSGSQPIKLGRVDLSLFNQGNHHFLSATVNLPKSLGRSFRLAANIDGDPFASSGWSSRIYIDTQKLKLGAIANALPPLPVGIRDGLLDAKIWLDWQGQLRSVAGQIQLKSPVLFHRAGNDEHRLVFNSLATRFAFESVAEGWRLDLKRFRPDLQGIWPDSQVSLLVSQGKDGLLDGISAAASRIDLADVATVIQSLGFGDKTVGEMMRVMSPRGIVNNARLYFKNNAPVGEKIAVCGRFQNMRANPWHMVPGFTAIDGQICGSDGKGWANLTSINGSVHLLGIGMKRPVPLEHFGADLRWRQTNSSWVLEVPELEARNAEISANSRIVLTLPKLQDSSPLLDVSCRLNNVTVSALRHYIPTVYMAQMHNWVEQSLFAGVIPEWNILFNGPALAYPFYNHEGVFKSSFEAKDVTYRFHPEWPLVTHAAARFEFEGHSATIDSSEGLVGTGRIQNAHADWEDFYRGSWFRMNGHVRTTVPEAMDFLSQSPMRSIPQRINKLMKVSGDTDIAMSFNLPLYDLQGNPEIKGTANFLGAAIKIDSLGIGLEQLVGAMDFDPRGIKANRVQGQLLGQPALVSAAQDAEKVDLMIQGRMQVDRMREFFPSDLWRFARGDMDYKMEIALPNSLDAQSAPIGLKLTSEMTGFLLDLPKPLGKEPEIAKSFSIETSYKADEPIPVQMALGQNVLARFIFKPKAGQYRLDAGDLAIGERLPPNEGLPGFSVMARLDELNADSWREFLRNFGGMDSDEEKFRKFGLETSKLLWNGKDYGPTKLDLLREGKRWRGQMASTLANGSVSLAPDLMDLDLEFVNLPDFDDKKTGDDVMKVSKDLPPEMDPALIPSIRLNAKKLKWKNADLGLLKLTTERHSHGMIIKELLVKGTASEMQIKGNWTRTPNRAASTHVSGEIKMPSLGDFMTLIGYGGKVRDTPTQISLEMDWPGSPLRFSTRTIIGNTSIKLGKGGLLTIEPGLGRIVGMLNLNSLWRRLSLDFSDLFGAGLAYDGIVGTFKVSDGNAHTDGLLIDAMSAKILMSGRLGLEVRDMDELVTVIPHASAALPIAGVLAGGPAVGAAMFLAEKLIGDQVDRIAAIQYSIRGGWQKPEIKRIYGNLPLDVLGKAWSKIQSLSESVGKKQENAQ